jgi:hypothetical protein
MKTELLSFGTAPLRRGRAPGVPFLVRHLAGRKTNRLPASLRIPVRPANWALLRNLRAAEMAAWEPRSGSKLTAARETQEASL